MDIIDGVIDNVIYRNETNGYTVFVVSPFGRGDEAVEMVPPVTCTATLNTVANPGESVKLSGQYTVHSLYGRQFGVSSYEKRVPQTAEHMLKYLSAGAIPGIRERTAAKIVKKFGDETAYIIEHTPERLAEVQGITPQKARQIGAVFKEQASKRAAMMFLQSYDVSMTFANKIFDRYGEETVKAVSENPYILADDITGIGFLTADKIAAKMGLTVDSMFRVKAGVKYVLQESMGDGHCFLPLEELAQRAGQTLTTERGIIDAALAELRFDRKIFVEDDAVFLTANYYMEGYVAKKLVALADYYYEDYFTGETADILIDAVEIDERIELAKNQRYAVKCALTTGMLVITGGPGTGKTTTLNAIIQIFDKAGFELKLAAPTGRAAKRLAETTGQKAETIHRLLGSMYANGGQRFDRNEDSPIDADVLIIDESSMIDLSLMHALLKAVALGTRMIFAGDVDQLPSVGAGNVLKDIIQGGVIETVRLNEIFRQSRESAIVMNAHRINKGEYPVVNDRSRDFFVVRRRSPEECAAAIRELFIERLPRFVGCDSADIQVLTPTRKGPLGVVELNMMLQQAQNPPDPTKTEKQGRFGFYTFRVGDRVMQTKNDYNMPWRIIDKSGHESEAGAGVFNGDEGRIFEIDERAETVGVLFDDGKVSVYDYAKVEELELSYAVTIHKSQGSEYKVVIIPLFGGPPMLMTRNLLYTAVTRAKQLVVIVGSDDTMFRMVDNNREHNRYTRLWSRIALMKRNIVN